LAKIKDEKTLKTHKFCLLVSTSVNSITVQKLEFAICSPSTITPDGVMVLNQTAMVEDPNIRHAIPVYTNKDPRCPNVTS